MKLIVNAPKKSLSKSFLKQRPLRSEINLFKSNLISLLDKIRIIEQESKNESEEHLKNNLRDFLLDTYYKDSNHINTKGKIDLVIHIGKNTSDDVGVIIETKRPSNFGEMISESNPNRKALHELILYYLEERNKHNNIQLKYLVATNIFEWYIFDANYFDKHIFRNSEIKKLYELKVNENKDNPFFYEAISKILAKDEFEFPCTYFDIRNYETVLRNDKTEDDKELIALYKILSPQQLLKIPSANDANSLNQNFYKELLYIIGLEEVKDKGKHVIRRKEKDKQAGSLIENTINILEVEDSLFRVKDKSSYGENKEEQLFNIALELCLTWINRILFLKLLEGLLLSYQKGNKDFAFLKINTIQGYDELYKLFHQVLAINTSGRKADIKNKYSLVPYLNSSLFEISDLEHEAIRINALDDSAKIDLFSSTVLKDEKAKNISLSPIEYLFKFLDSFDFSSEGGEDISEDNKSIITASVLGKVFEKINGYKDGSYFTPSFITMYMSRKALRLAVLQKFNEYFKANGLAELKEFEELYNAVARIDIKKANEIVNSLRICDPAVGSGHFLVSALNEMIIIKSELGILVDRNGKRLKDYEFIIDNDEIIISDENGIYEYNFKNKESQRVQEAIFHEKQTIIESCLFGVDINPNSVKICRLRLWIELLKSSYYKQSNNSPLERGRGVSEGVMELETLPNIDINIKCGNSLISRFALDADLSKALKSVKYNIDAYRGFVAEYRNVKDREVKRGLQKIIDSIKADFRTEISKNDPKLIRLEKATGELFNHLNQTSMFDMSEKQKKEFESKKKKLEAEIEKLTKEVEEIKSNAIYKNAFEWRFEFPEVLNDNGDFVGFDVVIGNPPYIQLQTMGKVADELSKFNYDTFIRTGDIYSLFIEKGIQIGNINSNLTFITSNKWMRAGYGLKLRYYLSERTSPVLLIDFAGFQIFDEATVDACILSTLKSNKSRNLEACTIGSDYNELISIGNYINDKKIIISGLSEKSWVISSDLEKSIGGKIGKIGIALQEWDIDIYRGILTGLNEAFIVDGKTKDEIISKDFLSRELIKPILRGRDIKRYKADFADLWLIMIPKGFTIKTMREVRNFKVSEPTPRYGYEPFDEAWEFIKEYYPGIANHLIGYKEKAEKRQDQGDYWWELRACSYLNDFSKEKIAWASVGETYFTYIPKDTLLLDTNYFSVFKDDLINKYILGLLNSKLLINILNTKDTKVGSVAYRHYKYNIETLPIPKISKEAQQPFIDLVEIILAKKERNEDTAVEEAEIDRMVYELYGLTEEEKLIIENG